MTVTEKKRTFLSLLGIFSLAVFLRLAFDIYLRRSYPFYDFPSSDVSYYLSWARSIALGQWNEQGGFSGLPLFPHFLALFYRLCLGKLPALRLAVLLLGSLNCALIYLIAQRLFSTRVGLIAGILCAVSFSCIYYDWLIMPPTLIIFLSAVIILSLLEKDKLKTRHWLLLGVLLGISILGDGKFLFFSLFVILYLAVTSRRQKTICVNALLPLVCGILMMLALSGVRNKILSGEWILISPQSGLSFYAGNNPRAKGYFENMEGIRPTHFGQDTDQILIAQSEAGEPLSKKEVSSFYRQKAIHFIVSNPADYMKLLAKKFGFFFREAEISFDLDLIFLRKTKGLLDFNPLTIMMPLAVVGMVLSFKTPRHKMIIFLVASQLILVLAFFFLNRFRASIVPFLIIYEAYCLNWLAVQVNQRRWLPVVVIMAGIVMFIFLNKPQPVEADIYNHLYHSKMGFVMEQKKDWPKAKRAYEKALAIEPLDESLLYNLGNVHYQMSDLKEARYYYLKTVEINPLHVDAYFNLGYVYELGKNNPRAEKAYLLALNLTPESTDIMYRLGALYLKNGNCHLARTYFTNIIKNEPARAHELSNTLNTCINK